MKQQQKAIGILVTITMFLLAAGVAWADQESAGEEATPPAVAEDGEGQAEDTAEENVEATGLDIVLDGSSLESFEKGLEEVKETCTANEYLTLEKSIQFLLFYDLSAKRDKAKLAERLDGMTGRQIMEKVVKRRG